MSPLQLAAIALFAILAIPIVGAVAIVMRSEQTLFQAILWQLAYLLAKVQWRAQWPSPLVLPPGVGGIVVSNHRSSVDPFFIQTATLRKVHWMVAREYCEHSAFAWFLRACEVIPVNRGGIDTAATKLAMRLARKGELVGMFPEGRINTTGDLMLPGRPGAALIALKARVPIIPCYIEGSPYRGTAWSPFLMRGRVTARFGKPIDLSTYFGREQEPGVVREVMVQVLKAIAELAGQPDYEPQFAGRKWKPTVGDTAGDSEPEPKGPDDSRTE